jgi:hypothetical protein
MLVMDKWLKIGNIKETKDNELSASADIPSHPKFEKSKSNDQIQGGTTNTELKKRKCDNKINFEFRCNCDKESSEPHCVMYDDVLANSSLKHSLIRRRLETRHPTQLNTLVDF